MKTASQVLTERHDLPLWELGYSQEEVESLMTNAFSQSLLSIKKMSPDQKCFLRDFLDLEVNEIFSGGLENA